MEINLMTNKEIFVKLEDYMLDRIKNASHIDHIVMGEILDEVNSNLLIELLKAPKEIMLSNNGLVYKNANGDYEECPSYGMNVTADGKWLSDKIEPICFDIQQDGNLRKAEEAQSAYCLIVINAVLNDEMIQNMIVEVINNYNFENMCPNGAYKSFSLLLKELQDIQSTTINIAVSAAKYNISNVKKDSEKFLKENIPENRISGLRELDTVISAINRKYSLGPLSPDVVGKLTKFEVLSLLDKRNKEINIKLNGGTDDKGLIVKAHPESTIWKILNLSSEYLNPIIKKRVMVSAADSVNDFYNQYPHLENVYGERKPLIEKWKKRYIKLARLSFRKIQIEKYLENEIEYQLPPKL